MVGVIWEEVVLFPMDCELANSLKLPLVRGLDSILHLVTETYPPIAGNRIVCTVPINPDSLCGLVVRASGCRPRSPGFDSRPYQVF
jgi:hypothetical protein